MIYLLGQISTFFITSAFAVASLCAGLAIGLVLGKRHVQESELQQEEIERLVSMLTHLLAWTHGVADDMSEYRSVMTGVSKLFRGNTDVLDEQQRDATVGLLRQVVEANEQLQNRLNQAEQMLQDQAGEISTYMSEARTDALTGLPNRRAFDEDLIRRMAEWKRHRRPLSVMMVDIDHFKKFNDTYGHQVGDDVLQQVAVLLRKTMRESDSVGRFGGEEMAVLLPGTEASEACQAAERARRAIEEAAFTHGQRQLHVTVSVGAAQCSTAESATRLVRRADEALYAAKQAGRNRCYWHDGHVCRRVGGMPNAVAPAAPASKAELPTEPSQSRGPVCENESFAEVCQDLRQRLEEVTGGLPQI